MKGRLGGMSDSEKMNALDFVINVLKEHEKTLDLLIEKLENALKSFPGVSEEAKMIAAAKRSINVQCEEWTEFREAGLKADAISFRIDGDLEIRALQGNVIYEYRESMNGHVKAMECGISVRFKTQVDPSEVRKVLSRELGVPENRILHGHIQFPE